MSARTALELMREASALPNGAAKVRCLEEAVRLADLEAFLATQVSARKALIDAAIFGGAPTVGLTAFSWLRALRARKPAEYGSSFFWEEKWILHALPKFSEVTRAQMERALDDFAKTLSSAGMGTNSAAKLRFIHAWLTGELERAKALFRIWRHAPRDSNSDCSACDVDAEVSWLFDLGLHEEALRAAKPLLSGRARCAEVPACTYGMLECSFFLTDDVSRAIELVPKARNAQRLGGSVTWAHNHLTFLALTKNFGPALTSFEAAALAAVNTPQAYVRVSFNRAIVLLLRLLGTDGARTVKLNLPSEHPLFERSSTYDVAVLLAHFERLTLADGDALDRRNGNSFFRRTYDDLEVLMQRARFVELKRSAAIKTE